MSNLTSDTKRQTLRAGDDKERAETHPLRVLVLSGPTLVKAK